MRYMSKKEFSLRLKKIQNDNEQIELREKLRAERNKFRRSKINKMNTSNKVLIAAIIAIVLFTIACLYIQYHIGTEVSSTLITLWFSFWTVEIVALTGIKISKVIKTQNSDTNTEQTDSSDSNDDSEAVG